MHHRIGVGQRAREVLVGQIAAMINLTIAIGGDDMPAAPPQRRHDALAEEAGGAGDEDGFHRPRPIRYPRARMTTPARMTRMPAILAGVSASPKSAHAASALTM
jgi:hypothetical protein